MPHSKDDMPLSDAIAYADRMRNSFRVFEKLGEVLTLASQAEVRERHANQAAAKLEKANSTLLEKQQALTKAVEGLERQYHGEVKEQQAAHGRRISEFKNLADAAQAESAATLKKLASELDTERKAKHTAIKRLEVEETRLEGVTGRLRQELQQLKSRIPDMA